MLSSSNYIPKGIVSNELYQKIVEAMDYVISNNEEDFKDILNKYKDFSDQNPEGCKITLAEFGFENIIRILDIPDTTAARLAYFINAISILKGHKEGLILVTRLLGGFAFISELYDFWKGYSSKTYALSTLFNSGDTVVMISPIDGLEYLYECIVTGTTGIAYPIRPIYLNETTIDGGVTWQNIGKAQKFEYWQANKTYVLNQHVIATTYTRYDASTGSTSIDPPNAAYAKAGVPKPHDTQGRHYIFECTQAGTTGAGEPAWDNTIGNVTVDNTAEWTCLDPEAYFTFNIVWTFPPGITTPHTFDYFRAFVRSYVYPTLISWVVAPAGSFQFSKYPNWSPNRALVLEDYVYPTTGHFQP